MTQYGEMIATPKAQSEKAREDQVQNNAGGFVFGLDCWKRLDRFLILGADAPTYYVDRKTHMKDNIAVVEECIRTDGVRAVKQIVEISKAARAPKNDPAIFALAVAASKGDDKTRATALDALMDVCRIGTHLFHFVKDVQEMRGWGPALSKAVSRWYNKRSADKLAMQVIKYQQRDGMSHRDVLRLAHVVPASSEHDAVLRYAATAGVKLEGEPTDKARAHKAKYRVAPGETIPAVIAAFERLHAATEEFSVKEISSIIREHGLPHECVPNEWKNKSEIWNAMLPSMGITAIIRNLGKMTAVGLLEPLSEAEKFVVGQLTDKDVLISGRVHPLAILIALGVYRQGHGEKGKLSWKPNPRIVDALDAGFYEAFGAVQPAGKKTLVAIDCSGSMTSGFSGSGHLSCRDAAAAMAMVTMKTEPSHHVVGFTSDLVELRISPRMRLDAVSQAMARVDWGSTDCARPMLYALERKMPVETFVVYTDNETWFGSVHPFEAMKRYRQKMGIDAKLVVVGMTATEFTIADPSDGGMLDVVGFDAAAPAVMADFARG